MIKFEIIGGDCDVTVGGDLPQLVSETETAIGAMVDAISEKHRIEKYRILEIINEHVASDIARIKHEDEEFWEMVRNLIENGD